MVRAGASFPRRRIRIAVERLEIGDEFRRVQRLLMKREKYANHTRKFLVLATLDQHVIAHALPSILFMFV